MLRRSAGLGALFLGLDVVSQMLVLQIPLSDWISQTFRSATLRIMSWKVGEVIFFSEK